MGVWVRAGTRNEHRSEAGVSHFLEHMLFKGTTERTAFDISRDIEQVGGEFNAFTTREATCFHMTLLKRDIDLGAEILSDIVLDSAFDQRELDRERKVILKEIAMTADSPEEFAFDTLFERLYGKHPLGRNILGSMSSIRKMSRAQVLKYFRLHYRPERVLIVAVGDVSHQKVANAFKILKRRSWPGRSGRVSSSKFKVDPAPKPTHGATWIKRPSEQAHLIWCVDGVKHTARERFAAALLNLRLGVGMSSRLFQEIREKRGLAYSVYSSLFPFLDSGLLAIYVGTSATHSRECARIVGDTLREMAAQRLSDEDLTALKNNLKGNLLLASDDVEARMTSIANGELFTHEHLSLHELCERIDAVTAHEVQRLARKFFRTESRTFLGLGPRIGVSPDKLLRI